MLATGGGNGALALFAEEQDGLLRAVEYNAAVMTGGEVVLGNLGERLVEIVVNVVG